MNRSDVPRIYAIADREALGGLSVSEAVVRMAAAGIRWIQLRDKLGPDRERWGELEASCRQLEGTDVALWVDDRVDLAALLPVFGVHLGQSDLSPSAARSQVPVDRMIGLSTHEPEQVLRADRDGVDVVAVGPVFSTLSKRNPDPVVGLDLVRRARSLTARPLVAIGGIDASNVGDVLLAGADSAVVLGAVCRAPDIGRACRDLLAAAA